MTETNNGRHHPNPAELFSRGRHHPNPAELFSRGQRRYVEVDIPSGGSVVLRSLSGAELEQLETIAAKRNTRETQALLVIYTWVDPRTLAPVLSEADLPKFTAEEGGLDERDFAVLCDAANRHTGARLEYDFRAFEEAEKN